MKLKFKLDTNGKVANFGNKCKNCLSMVVDFVADFGGALILVAAFMYLAFRGTELHGRLIRSSVGSKVYFLRDRENGGGGTGFAIKAPSGTSYILTNDHVCGVSSDKQTLLVENENGLRLRRRIIAKSEFTDLCLVEGVPNVDGLTVGSEPSKGEIVMSVGHPSLMPITLSRGEVISSEEINILVGPISTIDPETGKVIAIPPERGGIPTEQCSLPKNDKVDLSIFGIPVKFCVLSIKSAYKTNMIIKPGSSGSPVVNFWGNVVAVVFAGDESGWASLISQKDVVKFLKNY